MHIPGIHNYYVYITTNPTRTVLYTGMTRDLKARLHEHFKQSGKPQTFAGRYYCYRLVYYEWYSNVNDAIAREKQIKGWTRAKKEALIATTNPKWRFLSEHYFEDSLGKYCGNK